MFGAGVPVVLVRRRLVVDPYSGEETLGDWANATRTTLAGCAVAPTSSEEAPNVDYDRLVSKRTVYAPYGVDIRPDDRLELPVPDGGIWQVDGYPSHWRNPYTGDKFGCIVVVTRVEAKI